MQRLSTPKLSSAMPLSYDFQERQAKPPKQRQALYPTPISTASWTHSFTSLTFLGPRVLICHSFPCLFLGFLKTSSPPSLRIQTPQKNQLDCTFYVLISDLHHSPAQPGFWARLGRMPDPCDPFAPPLSRPLCIPALQPTASIQLCYSSLFFLQSPEYSPHPLLWKRWSVLQATSSLILHTLFSPIHAWLPSSHLWEK